MLEPFGLGLEVPKPTVQKRKPPARPDVKRARVWKDSRGEFSVLALFVSFGNGKVTLKKVETGEVISVPLERLSKEDQEWIKSLW